MPDLPISGLPAITVPNKAYLLAAVSQSITSKMTLAEVSAAISSSFTASSAISASYSLSSSYAQTASYWIGNTDYTPTAYLSAYHTASLAIPTINTPFTMSYSTLDFAQGISISGSWSDKIKVLDTGVYNIQFSAQTSKTTGTSSTLNIWLAKNGIEIPFSNTGVTLAGGANDVAIPAWNFYVSASAGDYYQLLFAATQDNTLIQFLPSGSAPSAGPAVPSVILTVNRVA